MSGHQYSCSTACKVFEIPGCPAVMWSWWLATTSLLKASFATTTIRPCRVHSPVAARVSPFGFCQVDISVGRSNCASKRRSSRVDNVKIDRFDMVANSWLGRTITCLLSCWPLSKSGRRDSGSAFMVLPGLWINAMLYSIR